MLRIFGMDVGEPMFLESSHLRFRAGKQLISDVPNAPAMWLTMRRDFDDRLCQLALAAGAVNFTGQALDRILPEQNEIRLKNGTVVTFQVLLGCDGVNSAVARSLFGRAFDPQKIGFGLEIEAPFDPQNPPENVVDVDFSAADWGYGWSFPKRMTTTLGVGGINAKNPAMKQKLRDFLMHNQGKDEWRVKGQYLPFGDFRRRPGRKNILLAGDAAGLVDPVTGEGIALAMHSGELAAQAAIRAVRQNVATSALRHYKRALKPTHRALRQAKIWRLLMFPKPMRGVFQSALASGTGLQEIYLNILAGKAEYKDIKGALVSRAPKAVFRMLRSKPRR